MALLSHATVKFSDEDTSDKLETVEPTLVSLERPQGGGTTQVLFGAALFDTHNNALKEFLQSLSPSSKPIDLSVMLDSTVLSDHPQQIEKIRNYIHAHQDALVQHSLHVSSASALTNLPTLLCDTVQDNSTLLLVSNFALLSAWSAQMKTLKKKNVNIVLISHLAQDHAMLSCDTAPLLSSLKGIVNESTLYQRASRESLQQFIATATLNATTQDSQLFHWVEGNAYQLGQLNELSIDYVVKRFFALQWEYNSDSQTNQRSSSWRLIHADAQFCNFIVEATQGQMTHADATALYLLLVCHSSVEAQLLDTGAEARVWHLLNTLGFTLWHKGLNTLYRNAACFPVANIEQLASIGQRTQTSVTISASGQSLFKWLKEQNDLLR